MNYESEKLKRDIENGNFFVNNGRILQLLNVISGDFKKLTEIKFCNKMKVSYAIKE